jgi:adenine phosphoribosyltransferase
MIFAAECEPPAIPSVAGNGPPFYTRRRISIAKGGRRMDLKEHIRGIPDFPKPGILFYDISTLLRDADAWQVAMGRMAKAVRAYQPDLLAGIESRGFLIAAPLALKLGCGFIMLRKRNKLPGVTVGLNYSLEYGTDRVEVQADAVEPGQRVVVVDDLLATGGTMSAGIALLRRVGAVVPAAAALIELTFLNGRSRLDVPCEALVSYDD